MTNSRPDLRVRGASDGDCRFYWEVNNAPSTRALSISTAPIPWESHQRWYAAKLGDPKTALQVAEANGQRVGVVRVDRDGPDVTISVALAPEHQGQGHGRRVIAAATQAALEDPATDRVIALIRPENPGSVRAFEAAGYVLIGEGESDGITLLRYEATA